MQYDTLIYNVRIASMQHNAQPYGQLSESVVALLKGVIAGVFNADAIHSLSARTMIDGQQQWLLPGFIDCHTHLVYGGNRANEFEMRLQGVSYKDIALQGGGIKSTVEQTRRANEASLFKSAAKRARRASTFRGPAGSSGASRRTDPLC